MELPKALGHLRDERIRGFAAYWLRLRAGSGVPCRRALDPLEFPWALPFVWMCDYLPGQDDFRYRLTGEAINQAHSSSLSRRLLSDVIRTDRYSETLQRYLRVIREPAIAHTIGPVYVDGRVSRQVLGERIAFPLSQDGSAIDMMLGMTVFDLDTGGAGGDLAVPQNESVFTPLTEL